MFSSRLRKVIKRHRMTDTEFMRYIGISRGTLNGLLYQDRQPNSVTLIKFRRKGINVDYLLLGSGPVLINQPTIIEQINTIFRRTLVIMASAIRKENHS